MDYLVTFLFVIIVAVGGWYYGCEVKGWCGTEPQGELSLDDVLAQVDTASEIQKQVQEEKEKEKANAEKDKKEESANEKKEDENKKDNDKSTKCDQYLSTKITPSGKNDKKAVIKLEEFLNEYEGEKLIAGGVYDSVDQAAVKRFQEKYRTDILDPADLDKPNAIVGEGTYTKINKIYCEKKG